MGLRQVACAHSELGLVWWRTFVTQMQTRARMVVPREP